jgi:EamA domain-containing membrane protein RarD
MKLVKLILPAVLAVETIYVWYCLYNAQFLEYDDNYGLMIHAFIISLVTLVALIIVWLKKKEWIKQNLMSMIAWLVLGSPLAIVLLVVFYQNIFGGTFSTG